ncbi:MAG TPA: NUDIX domain-containing protein [Candidatus Acidoferrales bacterium]|nr:NUDIX domain-containing protein [Candidatus Acidoferrales bacterium]
MRLPVEEYRRFLSTMPMVCVDCLVINDRGEFLLVKRVNEPLMGEHWVPGGRVYKGERLVDAVHRKMREEIGVDVDIVESLGFFEEFYEKTKENALGGVHSISFVYLVRPKNFDIKLDSQSSEWGWFKEIPDGLRKYATIRCPITH